MRDTGNRKGARAGLLPFALCALAGFATGCTDVHRSNDWADVITATLGDGYGTKARVGPFQAGLYTGNDMAGLRAGETGKHWGHIANYDYYWLFAGSEHFDGWIDNRGPVVRRKVVAAQYIFPCFILPEAPNPCRPEDMLDSTAGQKMTDGSKNHAFWTQFEFALGLGRTVRIGFNPGELLDALLGHVGIDLYGDDTTPDEEAEKRRHLEFVRNPGVEENRPRLIPFREEAGGAP